MSYVSVAGLTVAIEELLVAGIGEVEQHAARRADLLVRTVEPLGWHPYRAPDGPAGSPHLVTLTGPDRSAAGVVERLRRRGIVCSSRGERLRVSLAPYNDHTDIEALADALT